MKTNRSGDGSMPAMLTPRQLQIVRYIGQCRNNNGYSPTLQELAGELGISKVTVFEHVEALVKKGVLLREPNRARSLAINPASGLDRQCAEDGGDTGARTDSGAVRFPLLGSIAAGLPVDASTLAESLDVGELFAVGPGVFALRVQGESMIDDHIRPGDYVLIEPEASPRNGQTVAALLPNGETTLKLFYREGGRIRLQPANAEYAPIYVAEAQVQGVVVGLVRRYH